MIKHVFPIYGIRKPQYVLTELMLNKGLLQCPKTLIDINVKLYHNAQVLLAVRSA